MSDHISGACQQYLHQKQQRCHKQKRKFNGLRDTCGNAGQGSRQQQASGAPLFFRLGAVVHGQCRTGQTKDHENKFPGKISGGIGAEMCHIGRIRQLGKENILAPLDQLAAHLHGTAHRGLPKRHIKYMVQTKRNQRPLDQSENQRSCIPGPGDQPSQRIYSILH